jgi:hypothetical protein|nr:MAG TPA: hypothetical protein [Caudoviricetes sp.]
MKIMKLDTIEIKVDDESIIQLMERFTMESNQEILIRNKEETKRLAKKIVESSERMRKQQYLEAIEANNKLYLKSIYESLSLKDLLKLLMLKVHNRL